MGGEVRQTSHFLVALLCAIVSLPIVVLALCLCFLCTGRNPFFFQKRTGLNGKMFWIFKLRTLDDEGRHVPIIGKLLRRSKIDELPQFWNILLGDMALVGPRPLDVTYAEKFKQQFESIYIERYSIRPGLTGLAQVRGQAHDWAGNSKAMDSDLEFLARVKDGWFTSDLRILVATPISILLPQNGKSIVIEESVQQELVHS